MLQVKWAEGLHNHTLLIDKVHNHTDMWPILPGRGMQGGGGVKGSRGKRGGRGGSCVLKLLPFEGWFIGFSPGALGCLSILDGNNKRTVVHHAVLCHVLIRFGFGTK